MRPLKVLSDTNRHKLPGAVVCLPYPGRVQHLLAFRSKTAHVTFKPEIGCDLTRIERKTYRAAVQCNSGRGVRNDHAGIADTCRNIRYTAGPKAGSPTKPEKPCLLRIATGLNVEHTGGEAIMLSQCLI